MVFPSKKTFAPNLELDGREGAGIGLRGDLRGRRQRHQPEGGDEQRRNETAGPPEFDLWVEAEKACLARAFGDPRARMGVIPSCNARRT